MQGTPDESDLCNITRLLLPRTFFRKTRSLPLTLHPLPCALHTRYRFSDYAGESLAERAEERAVAAASKHGLCCYGGGGEGAAGGAGGGAGGVMSKFWAAAAQADQALLPRAFGVYTSAEREGPPPPLQLPPQARQAQQGLLSTGRRVLKRGRGGWSSDDDDDDDDEEFSSDDERHYRVRNPYRDKASGRRKVARGSAYAREGAAATAGAAWSAGWKKWACPMQGCGKRYVKQRRCASHPGTMCVKGIAPPQPAERATLPTQGRGVGKGGDGGGNDDLTEVDFCDVCRRADKEDQLLICENCVTGWTSSEEEEEEEEEKEEEKEEAGNDDDDDDERKEGAGAAEGEDGDEAPSGDGFDCIAGGEAKRAGLEAQAAKAAAEATAKATAKAAARAKAVEKAVAKAAAKAAARARAAAGLTCTGSAHTFCLGLAAVPDGDWYCAACAGRQASALVGVEAALAGDASRSDAATRRRQFAARARAQPFAYGWLGADGGGADDEGGEGGEGGGGGGAGAEDGDEDGDDAESEGAIDWGSEEEPLADQEGVSRGGADERTLGKDEDDGDGDVNDHEAAEKNGDEEEVEEDEEDEACDERPTKRPKVPAVASRSRSGRSVVLLSDAGTVRCAHSLSSLSHPPPPPLPPPPPPPPHTHTRARTHTTHHQEHWPFSCIRYLCACVSAH